MVLLPGAIWLFKNMDIGDLDIGDMLGTLHIPDSNFLSFIPNSTIIINYFSLVIM